MHLAPSSAHSASAASPRSSSGASSLRGPPLWGTSASFSPRSSAGRLSLSLRGGRRRGETDPQPRRLNTSVT